MSEEIKHLTKPFNPIEWPASPHDYTGDYNLGIHTTESTQRYMLGTRYTTWDGRVYKYSHAVAAVKAEMGAKNNYAQPVAWSALGGAVPVGSRVITITTGATAVGTDNGNTSIFSKDGLSGGSVCTFDGGVKGMRGIIANDAVATGGGTLKLYVDDPVNIALTTSDTAEVIASPYINLRQTSSQAGPSICVPVVASGAGTYFWGQTWGVCYCSAQATAGKNDVAAQENFHLIFRADGSVESHVNASAVGGTGYNYYQQHAGFVLACGATRGQGLPFFMLQISI